MSAPALIRERLLQPMQPMQLMRLVGLVGHQRRLQRSAPRVMP